jgi:hypothetical protein
MLNNLFKKLRGERILFNTAIATRYPTGKAVQIKLGGGNKALFRVTRVVRSKPVKTFNNGTRECYEVWGKELIKTD